jgi:hypothetical protein
MKIALVAVSALIGLALVLPLTPAPANACGRCWNGQSDENRDEHSNVANEHLEYAGNNK